MGRKPQSRLEALLIELCVGYGYCLPLDDWTALVADPPADVDAFVDAVLVVEGEDPSRCDKHVRRELGNVVADWLFDDGRGKGSRSGLPRHPS